MLQFLMKRLESFWTTIGIFAPNLLRMTSPDNETIRDILDWLPGIVFTIFLITVVVAHVRKSDILGDVLVPAKRSMMPVLLLLAMLLLGGLLLLYRPVKAIPILPILFSLPFLVGFKSSLEIRRKGISANGKIVPWEDIAERRWNQDSQLEFKIRPSLLNLSPRVRVSVAAQDKTNIEATLQRWLGDESLRRKLTLPGDLQELGLGSGL